MNRRSAPSLLLAGLAFVVGACDTPAPAATPPSRTPTTAAPSVPGSETPEVGATPSASDSPPSKLTVVFLLDSAPEGAQERATPALQGAELALSAATAELTVGVPIQLVAFDLDGEPARLDELSADIAEDPSYVAVIVAPSVAPQRALPAALEVPVVSLSARDRPEDTARGDWLRLVPRIDVQGAVLGARVAASHASRGGVCLGPSSGDGSLLATAVRRALADPDAASAIDTAAEIRADGCGMIAWTGDATSTAQLLEALGRPRPRMVGGPGLLEPALLDEAGTLADRVEAVCGCVDLSTSLEFRAQRFIQVFQSEYGRSPGPGAVEAWDAARLVVRGLTEAGPTRTALAGWIASQPSFDGLGGEYRFDDTGELSHPARSVRTYRVEGGRWVPTGAASLDDAR